MKNIAAAMFAVALLLLTQPGLAVAGPGGGKGGFGFGGHGPHFHNKHAMHKGAWWWKNNNWYATNNGQLWWHNNKQWWYYGYGGVYATQPAVTETVTVPVAVTTVEARPCVRVQQPVTVRSEDGGDRTVYVTRCQN